MMSVMSVMPDTWMDFAEMTWMGLVLTSFGAAMREPVTMISCSGGESAATGGACCVEPGTAWASKILSEVGVLACCGGAGIRGACSARGRWYRCPGSL